MLCVILLLAVIPANVAVNDKLKKNPRAIAQPSISDIREFNQTKDISAVLNKTSGELKISKWDAETYLSIKTLDDPISNHFDNEKQTLEYDGYISRIYEVEAGIEFEVILPSNPVLNIFYFKIKTKGIRFFYQTSLMNEPFPKDWTVNETHAFNDKGVLIAERPIDIVGSYAVFHESKRDNEYKTGKFGHIYSPLIYDSNGSSIYGELLIEGELLSIEIDQDWLNNAVYPVVIDPTFGNTVAGGSGWTINDDEIFGFQASPANDGTLDNISAHVAISNTETSYNKAGLYDDSDNTFLTNSETDIGIHVGDGAYNWETWVNSDPKASILSSDTYIISLFHDNTTNAQFTVVHYDNGANNYGHRNLDGVFPTWEDPVGWTWEDVKYFSIYANYNFTPSYYLISNTLAISTLIHAHNATVSMYLETNSTPAFYWFSHNVSGTMVNQTEFAWTLNGTVYWWFWIPPMVGFNLGVEGYANTTHNEAGTGDLAGLITDPTGVGIGPILAVFLLIPAIGVLLGSWKR